MTPRRARHALLLLTFTGALCIGAVSATARDRGDHDGGWSMPNWGAHPTLPAPAALVFGGLAVSAALAAARRRKSKDDSESHRDDESGGDSK